MTQRSSLHNLIEILPDDKLATAQEFLRFLASEHPAIQALRNAPIDDEPTTEEDHHALEEFQADLAAGRVIECEPDQLLKKFGF